ncbi:MAG TPA: galactokinase [Vicinamibacterales bacterium]|nr:galactokinase [Vicinamibacterales bacterium]
MVRDRLIQTVRQNFAERFRAAPASVAVAPGRINLIGEHTDYNDGFVLPMAIDRYVAIAFSPRHDRTLRVFSSTFQQVREISLETLERRLAEPARRSGRGGWFGYIAGVAWAMLGAGQRVAGADMAIAGDLPVGAGLSSSAALEIAVSRVLSDVAGGDWDPRTAARLAQRAEHEFAGVACGIMDQLSVAAARERHALLLDCRSLDWRDVPIPPAARILVFDSGMPRALAASAYNDRRAACDRVVAAMRKRHSWVHALRDADDALLAEVAGELDAVDVRRAAHVIAENRRPLEMATAFEAGDLGRAGRLMMHSHASLRDLYEVSSPELDALVDLALEQPGCTGARLTGAGFGGCAIALVEAGSVERVMSSVEAGYEQRMGRTTTAFVCEASAGAGIVQPAA